jgi:CelD/BcsL family acetyltransferase involved in cellulose biosynthesis
MKITLAAGAEAVRLLNDARFRAEWSDLYGRCPWATVFQTAAFLDPWFEIYGDRYQPLLVMGARRDGSLDGLLTLVQAGGSGELAHAGTHHAEYQVWLSAPEDGNAFIELALDALARRFPRATLRFLYLPPGAPLEWTAAGARWERRSERVPLPVPLLALGDSKAIEALRKKRFRKCGGKLDEIERRGGLELEHIEAPERFAELFDEIIEYCDFRQGAAHDSLPFRRDPRKKLLYLAMARVPGLLDIWVLRAGGRLASAALCFRSRGRAVLGIITHSPFLAAYSVGSLHIPILAAKLAVERSATHLDLPPGGNYKDRFANTYEESSILTVRLDPRAAARRKREQRTADAVRSVLTRLGLWAKAKAAAATLRRPWASLARVRAWCWSTAEVSLYVLDAARLGPPILSGMLRRDSLGDLLQQLPPAPQRFLKQALARFERSGHAYTSHEESCRIWTAPGGEKIPVPETGQELALPPGAAAIYDFAAGRPRPGLYEKVLREALGREFSGAAGIERVYTWIRPADPERRVALEKAGFVYAGTIRRRARAGRVTLESPVPDGPP